MDERKGRVGCCQSSRDVTNWSSSSNITSEEQWSKCPFYPFLAVIDDLSNTVASPRLAFSYIIQPKGVNEMEIFALKWRDG